MFSYTWSNFRGNYTGLTSSDVADGGGGRNAPDNSRSFDEPYFSWNATSQRRIFQRIATHGSSECAEGLRVLSIALGASQVSDFGVFQDAYSGTPLTSYADVGYSFPSGAAGVPPSGAFPTDIVNRGKWIDVSQSPTTGLITVSNPYTKRTPWYTQTDFDFRQNVKMGESKALTFGATFTNILNQHSPVSFNQEVDSGFSANFLSPTSSGCQAYNNMFTESPAPQTASCPTDPLFTPRPWQSTTTWAR